MIKAFQNAFKIPELRQRIIFTALLLIVYRLGAHITLPGIDDVALEKFFDDLRGRTGGSVLDFVDLFAGGAFTQMTIFALGIQPYISASIVMQLLTVVIPFLEKLSKEPDGRKKITQYTRYATVILSAIQGIMISLMLQRPGAIIRSENIEIVTNPGIWWTLLTMITLMAGTSFVMWLGEQITERGIGQGISLIITIGILSAMPGGVQTIFNQLLQGQINLPQLVIFLALGVVAIMGTVYITFCVRKIPVQYARRVVGRKVMGGQATHIPLRVNAAGMIPIIFAVTLMQFPATVLGLMQSQFPSWAWIGGLIAVFSATSPLYWTIYALLIIGFTYFYTAVQINPVQMADDLRKYGGFIPGIRPGKRTADYINDTLTRITLPGAVFLAAIAVFPLLLQGWLGTGALISGASILIVVGVVLDTVSQIESYLTMRHYEGFLKDRRVRGRRTR
ncbi:preprotein translocase subunit SecY [Candidatus Poribacteria bacterium]|nr:preprotein translocase subunit SecY [Candidatus Poribacteria bacterium]